MQLESKHLTFKSPWVGSSLWHLDMQAPAAFVPGSKEDAADAVATYTAAMRARSAAAAIGRTSPLRPKVRIPDAHMLSVWPSDALRIAGWH